MSRALLRPGRLELHVQLTFPSTSEQETLVRHFASCLRLGMNANLKPPSLSSSSSFAADNDETCIISEQEQGTRKQLQTSNDDEVVSIVALANQVLQEVEAEMLDLLREQNTFLPSIW